MSGGGGTAAGPDRQGSHKGSPHNIVRILTILVAAVLLGGLFWGIRSYQKYRQAHAWTTDRDLSVYFANSEEVAASIRKGLREHAWRIQIRFTSHGDNMEDITEIVHQLMEYALRETEDPTEGDYIRYQYGGYEVRYSHEARADGTYAYTVYIIPSYYTSPDQEAAVTAEVQRIIAGFGFSAATSDYEKARAICDYVHAHVSFDRIHNKNPHYHLKTTAYAALFHHTAVCQGYAVLLYRLFREAGLEARVITGTAVNELGAEYHAWNIVGIDGRFYNLDATWNAQLGRQEYLFRSPSGFTGHEREARFLTPEFTKAYPMAEEDYPLPQP